MEGTSLVLHSEIRRNCVADYGVSISYIVRDLGLWAELLSYWVPPNCKYDPGPLLTKKTPSYGYRDPIINLRRSDDRLRFNMGIPTLIRRRLLRE